MSNETPSDEEVAARVRAAVAGDFQPEHVNGFPMKPEEGYFDLVNPSSYHDSIFVVSCIVLFPISSRLMPVVTGGHRRSVLEASGEGGRRRSREKACLRREAKVRKGHGEEERKEEEPRAASAREVPSQVEARGGL